MLNYFKNLNWLKLAKILTILIIAYLVISFGICLFKYQTFQYNGLDLAIFNQVFYNSSLGNLFQFTIHPTSYLGDHFTPLLFFLVPFYSLCKSPVTLLFLQSLFLGLTAIPLYLIAKKHLTPWQTLLIIGLYLFNPVTLNINLYEFHFLAFVPFFIAWTFYFYQNNQFKPFLVLIILSLLIREDVSFIIFMFGFIAILDKKRFKWILTPLFLSLIYFFTALKIIAHYSSAQTYKFFIYYQWLGENPKEIFINFFLKPHLVLEHIFYLGNLELILGFGLVFLFIPFYRPKYLLLCLGMFMQIILGLPSGELILRTHYGTILLIAFSLAAIFSLKALTVNQKFLNFFKKNKDLFYLIIIIGLIYNLLILGPFIAFVQKISKIDYQELKLKNEFIKQIPKKAALVASYDLITNLSSRPQIYSLNYLFLGRQQYGAGDYKIPDKTPFILINFTDFFTFHLQYENRISDYYYQGDNNLNKIIKEKNYQLKTIKQNLALWQKDHQPNKIPLYQIYKNNLPEIKQAKEQKLNQEILFLGSNEEKNITSLYFKVLSDIEKNYFIKINERVYPLGYGLYPTSEWQKDQVVKINFFALPQLEKIKILDLAGGLELDDLGSIKNVLDKKEIISQINLN